jgi:hypothetical protein
VLIAAWRLVDRLRHGPARADDLARLRQRFADADGPGEAGLAELEAARELRALRAKMIAAIGSVESCAGCAKGHPEPHGHWHGGHCCGTTTSNVYGDDEVASLALTGTTPLRLRPPAGDFAGCSFRGPTGCSLEVDDRPSLCVRYLCRELEAELRERGDLPAIKAIAREMVDAFTRFSKARELRTGERGQVSRGPRVVVVEEGGAADEAASPDGEGPTAPRA